MRRIVLACLVLLTSFSFYSCQPYGKKVQVNDHLEVYIKKDATEEEAKKLGSYIASLDSSNTNEKSVQLSKENNVYTVRLVIPEESLKDKTLEDSFSALQYLIKENVFPNQTVKLILADDEFKDKRAVQEMAASPEEESAAEALPADSTQQ